MVQFDKSPYLSCRSQIQVGFYRGVVAPLFEEWHRLMNSRLSTAMLHHFISNQARWDLMVQQETRGGVMMESAASTTSSSNGGSSESRRESFDPASSLSAPGFRDSSGQSGFRDRPHRFSRSSAEGDDDSDPCSSYPYLPLDQCQEDLAHQPAAAKPGALSAMLSEEVAGFTRRHSLPLSEIRSARQAMLAASRTSSEESAETPSPLQQRPSTSSSLHRQYSLVERRR